MRRQAGGLLFPDSNSGLYASHYGYFAIQDNDIEIYPIGDHQCLLTVFHGRDFIVCVLDNGGCQLTVEGRVPIEDRASVHYWGLGLDVLSLHEFSGIHSYISKLMRKIFLPMVPELKHYGPVSAQPA